MLNRLSEKPEPELAACVYNILSSQNSISSSSAHLKRLGLGLERASDLLVEGKLIAELVD